MKRDLIMVVYWGGCSAQSEGRIIPPKPELSAIIGFWKQAGMRQHAVQPPLLYHPSLIIAQAQARLLSAVTPDMGYKFFFWRGKKAQWGRGATVHLQCPRTPSADDGAGIPSKRCCSTCISHHHAAHLHLLPPCSPPAASAVSQTILVQTGQLLQSADTQLAQQCPAGCSRAKAKPCCPVPSFCARCTRPCCLCTSAMAKTLSCSFRKASTA